MVTCQRSSQIATVAERAVNAARSQHSTTAAESYGQTRARSLAANLTRIDAELAVLEREITGMLMRHEHAETLLSVPGFGPILAADFIANTGGGNERVRNLLTGSPAWPASRPHLAIPGGSAGTYTGPNATTADCYAPATLPRCPA